MPDYNFRCKKCGTEFEVSMTLKEKEASNPKCPKCSSTETKQVFSMTKVVDDMTTPEPPPEMPPGGGMGGMPPGMGMPGMGGCGMGGMCGPGF